MRPIEEISIQLMLTRLCITVGYSQIKELEEISIQLMLTLLCFAVGYSQIEELEEISIQLMLTLLCITVDYSQIEELEEIELDACESRRDIATFGIGICFDTFYQCNGVQRTVMERYCRYSQWHWYCHWHCHYYCCLSYIETGINCPMGSDKIIQR